MYSSLLIIRDPLTICHISKRSDLLVWILFKFSFMTNFKQLLTSTFSLYWQQITSPANTPTWISKWVVPGFCADLKNKTKQEALGERTPSPSQLTLWARFTLKRRVSHFPYIYFFFKGTLRNPQCSKNKCGLLLFAHFNIPDIILSMAIPHV